MKKLFLIFTLLILLTGCKQQRDYTLLFTSDYEYGNDTSYIVSYDQKGNITDKNEIEGALFYNINNIGENYFLNNGKLSIILDSQLNINSSLKIKNNLGIIEIGDSFVFKNKIIDIHNYGYENEKEYFTKVSIRNSVKNITLNGRNLNYVIEKNNLYVLLRRENDIYLDVIDLKQLKIKKSCFIETIHDDIDIFGLKEVAIHNKLMYFVELNGIIKFVTYELNTSDIQKYNISKYIKNSSIIPTSIFEYNNKIFFISTKKELLFINNNGIVEHTNLILPDDYGTFLLIKKGKDSLFILDSGHIPKGIIIDLNNYSIKRKVVFDIEKEFKNMDVYAFCYE